MRHVWDRWVPGRGAGRRTGRAAIRLAVPTAVALVVWSCSGGGNPSSPAASSASVRNGSPGTTGVVLVPTTFPAPSESTREPSSTAPPRVVSWVPPSVEVRAAFEQLGRRCPGLRLYVPTRLPAGTTIPPRWWPVTSGKSPGSWKGPALGNPRVTGSEGDPEVSVVLRVGTGDVWLELLERVKGDLGDLPARPADDVAGLPAASYRLHGGDLVQWSDGGVWFAAYGRHLAAGVTAEVARGMRPTEGG